MPWDIEPTAIAAHEFDPGMLLQPVRGPMRGAGLQNIQYPAPLEIDDNGSVSEAFAPAPVVDRNGAQRFDFTLLPDMALQLPQDGVVTDRHCQARQQPFADTPAGGMGEQSNEFANSLCFPRGRQRNRQRFGECLSNTLLVATSPAARVNLQRRRNPLNWKLLQPSHLPTVPRSGSFSAARTRSPSLTLRRYHPAIPTERHALHDNPRPEGQFGCLRHPPDNAEAANQGKSSTKSDADPSILEGRVRTLLPFIGPPPRDFL
jgi:hypothetical protein